MITDTIVAIATALQNQAISIVRLSGTESIKIASKLMKKDLLIVESHTIHYGYIYDNDKKIDEVLVSVFKAPRTFTREDVIEINCHGGVYITNQILQLCIEMGARLAKNGEFSERAFLNGRIDLTQAESILDLIDSRYEKEAELAVSGLTGKIKQKMIDLREQLIKIIAQIEVNIDYPEYDEVEILTANQLLPKTDALIAQINQLIESSKQGQLLKDGIKTAIVGRPNVGKSSLLNAFLNEQKAIVTDIEGTTRDIVEGEVIVGGLKLQLIDTAGIRESDDLVEKLGIEKSLSMMNQADLVLLVLDQSRQLTKEDEILIELVKDRPHLIILNKCDLDKQLQLDGIEISAKNQNLDSLIEAIMEKYQLSDFENQSQLLISNTRHITLLKKTRNILLEARNAMLSGLETEFMIVDLTEAFHYLNEILGKEVKIELLDEIFSRFCLGK